jgi:hypothetical protein
MLATLPIARRLFRLAHSRVWVAVLMIPIGAVAAYSLLPRVFVYAKF